MSGPTNSGRPSAESQQGPSNRAPRHRPRKPQLQSGAESSSPQQIPEGSRKQRRYVPRSENVSPNSNSDTRSKPSGIKPNRKQYHPRNKAKGGSLQDLASRDSLVCPICCEKFDELELRFYPCPCSYRVCAMCIHLIKEKADGKCPNCREVYEDERQRLADKVDKGLARVLRQVTAEEEREARQAKQKATKPIFQSSTKPRYNRSHHVVLCEKEIDKILAAHQAGKSTNQSTKESSPVITPAPEIKLTRFSGGLSVWD